MYESWIEDMVEKNKFAKNYSILTGSFFNMEMAQKMIDSEKPDYESTEEDFEETTRWIEESIKQEQGQTKKRHQRKGVIR